MSRDYNGLVLADIHIGAIPVSQTYKEINFLRKYLVNKYFSFIIIAGDLFDKKLYSGEDYIVIANQLILLLMSKCDKLRVIEGTSSHDNNQYSIFKQYEETSIHKILQKNIDFKIIESVQEEMLFPDLEVLYIPEEYIYDKKEYYRNFFNTEDKYDYVFGHGIIQEAMSNAVKNTNKSKEHRKKAPIFSTFELEKICKGKVYFGHYHVNTNIHDKVFYVGSYSRDKFGEEEPKGFYELSCNDNKYSEKFIENTITENYLTISFPYNHKIFNPDVDLVKEFDNIKNKKKESGVEHLRLIFNIPDEYPNPEFFINIVNDTFKNTHEYKLDIVNGYIKTKKNINKQKFREIRDKFNYIFDENSNIEDNISGYSRDKLNREISPEKVNKYLNFKAIDILKME